MSARNYTYYDFTQSMCNTCLERVGAATELSVNYHGLFPTLKDRFCTCFRYLRASYRNQPLDRWRSTPHLSMRSFSILDYLLSFIQSAAPIKYEVPCSGFTWRPMDYFDFWKNLFGAIHLRRKWQSLHLYKFYYWLLWFILVGSFTTMS